MSSRSPLQGGKVAVRIKVAINRSPAQFRSRNLVQVVISALANSGLPPRRLELEITESVFLAETETISQSCTSCASLEFPSRWTILEQVIPA